MNEPLQLAGVLQLLSSPLAGEGAGVGGLRGQLTKLLLDGRLALTPLNRRTFLTRGVQALLAMSAASGDRRAAAEENKPKLRIGLITDLHYADKPPAMNRHYRDTPAKLAEALARFADARIDLLIELGDLVDAAESIETEKAWLRRMVKQLDSLAVKRCCVLGNHCVQTLTKDEFLAIAGQPRSYYSFDQGGCHLVILDACFRSDGVAYGRDNFKWRDACLPPAELAWLEQDLRHTSLKTLVFVHQRLDVGPPFGLSNAVAVRQVLEQSGKVLAVFQGHHHPGDDQTLHGIRYVTLKAMVEGAAPENNAYALLDVLPDNTLRLTGFGRQRGF